MKINPCVLKLSANALLLLTLPCQVHADGAEVDKVYNPYVQPLEQEFEYRLLHEQDSPRSNSRTRHKLGYGRAISDSVFTELYLIGSEESGRGFDLEGYELELKWQLTEQGEYSNDWGLLFELEKEHHQNIWEAKSTLIAVHEWSHWIGTANFSVSYEWGDIEQELETAFSGQMRYRFREPLEPAIELYRAEDLQGIGPVLTGLWRIGRAKKLFWEFGLIVGTNSASPNRSWKLNLEYEF